MLVDPLTLYKDGESYRVPAIDAGAWLRLGWSSESEQKTENSSTQLKPENLPTETTKVENNLESKPSEEPVENPTSDAKVEGKRKNERTNSNPV